MAAKKPTTKAKAKSATKKSAEKKTTAKKAKVTVKKAATKPATKKAATKKAAAKKPVVKKASAKKTPAKKAAAPKAAPKAAAKTAAKPAPKAAAKAAQPAAKAAPAVAKPAPKPAPKKPVKPEYKRKEFVVYPAHGVGQITDLEEREVAGVKLALYVITFEKDKMTLRVPIAKAKAVGMRRLSPPDVIQNALTTLRGRARIKRTMWSRRAQEYEAKINSGDLICIAEVVRDLHRGPGQPEQSYSERQLYEAAVERMAREVAVADGLEEAAAVEKLESVLHKDAA